MFEIKYRFTGNHTEITSNVDETTLRYELFLGSISLEKDDKKISMDWKWIPLLDFALCLFNICNQLNEQVAGEEVFEFTESDATITFHRDADECKIIPSFSDVIFTMKYTEFQKAVKVFCKKIVANILIQNKGLKNIILFDKSQFSLNFISK